MSESKYLDHIDHSGIIESVDYTSGIVKVRIDDSDECGECPASKFCHGEGQPSNLIAVIVSDSTKYKAGDIVTVRGTERMHRKAILYATVIPCIVLIAVMVGIYLLTDSQLAAALSGLGATFVCYILIWLFRKKIAHEFTFEIIGRPDRAEMGKEGMR